MTEYYQNFDLAAKNIVERVGKTIVMGVPLGIGKPIGLLNAIYRLACEDSSVHLTIFTGLTLARPTLHNELEKRFINPIMDRMLQDYEDPLYERARELQQLPKNIRVIEFFLTPGKYLHNNYAQQNYMSSIYTCVARDLLHFRLNVIAQQVARSPSHPDHFSLSSNADLFYEVVNNLERSPEYGKKIILAAEINTNLPYMPGHDAEVAVKDFHIVADTGRYRALFPLPREPLAAQDHLIGFYTSCLVKDGGTLQIGIGKLSNAIASALIHRHKNNALYQDLLKQLSIESKFKDVITQVGNTNVFSEGLYASTEMLSDEYLQLYNHGILKKRVYDHIGLQGLLNEKIISERITPEIIDVLLAQKIIQPILSLLDFQFLQKFGILKADIKFQDGNLILLNSTKIFADLTNAKNKQEIIIKCLGDHLIGGKIIHAAFFLGSTEFYKQLNQLSPDVLQQMAMTSVARTNALSWSNDLLRLQRQHGRFINSTMMVTLAGGSVSDGLKDMQIVSGVGGQFDFINMAQQLSDARAITILHSTRKTKNGIQSNIVWEYSNQTIPHYLHDIFITEYGIADCRSKTDAEVIQALLNITDSRFQSEFLAKAKRLGKLANDYEIPTIFQNNFPEVIQPIVNEFCIKGYCSTYPFGSDLTPEEEVIAAAVADLKYYNRFKIIKLMFAAIFFISSDDKYKKYLNRLQLMQPKNMKEWFYKKLVKWLIRKYI